MDAVKLTLELTEEEAEALAQMVKRFDPITDAERFGNRFDGGKENDAIRRGVRKLRQALDKEGFSPR